MDYRVSLILLHLSCQVTFISSQTDTFSLVAGDHECEGIVKVAVSGSAGEEAVDGGGSLVACSREFGNHEATVLCPQLGCAVGTRVHPLVFSNYTLPTELSLTASMPYICTGDELSLQECQVAGSVCNILNNGQADLVAVQCEMLPEVNVTMPEVTTNSGTNENISIIVLFLFIAVTFVLRM